MRFLSSPIPVIIRNDANIIELRQTTLKNIISLLPIPIYLSNEYGVWNS